MLRNAGAVRCGASRTLDKSRFETPLPNRKAIFQLLQGKYATAGSSGFKFDFGSGNSKVVNGWALWQGNNTSCGTWRCVSGPFVAPRGCSCRVEGRRHVRAGYPIFRQNG